jgi:hypothetical protein
MLISVSMITGSRPRIQPVRRPCAVCVCAPRLQCAMRSRITCEARSRISVRSPPVSFCTRMAVIRNCRSRDGTRAAHLQQARRGIAVPASAADRLAQTQSPAGRCICSATRSIDDPTAVARAQRRAPSNRSPRAARALNAFRRLPRLNRSTPYGTSGPGDHSQLSQQETSARTSRQSSRNTNRQAPRLRWQVPRRPRSCSLFACIVSSALSFFAEPVAIEKCAQPSRAKVTAAAWSSPSPVPSRRPALMRPH